jgi:hypothetical protein
MVKVERSGSSRFVLLSLAAVCAVIFSMLISSGRALAGEVVDDQGIKTGNGIGFDGCADGNDAQEWHFVITSIADPSLAPASITAVFDGVPEIVPLDTVGHPPDGVTGGTAHYVTTAHLDATDVEGTATIYGEWSGNFNVSHGPCLVVETPEIPTETPTQDIPTETPTDVPTETPTATGTVGGGGEETPTNTPPVEVTETVGGEEETPVPSSTATTAPADPTETAEPVDELPNTGTNPGSTGTSGLLAAALLAVVLAGTGLLLRRRSVSAGR